MFSGANAQEATVDVGTLGTISEPADGSVITSLSYTVSGLTIDSDGVLNDTATFTFSVSPLGTGPINWDQNTGVREFDYNNGTFSTGEGITFGNISVSGTGSGGAGYQLNSALFTEFTVRRWGNGDEFTIDGDVTDTTVTNGSGGPTVALNDNFFTAEATAGTWNATDVDFTVDISSAAVPEPSSIIMLVTGIGMLTMRRRRV